MRIIAVNGPIPLEQVNALSEMLVACIRGGATLGYISGTGMETTSAYWNSTIDAACAGRIALLIALDHQETVTGTVQISVHFPPNQSHVAGIQMLLVHPDFRRQGIARYLVQAAESLCRRMDRTLIVLETAGGPAGTLYASLGFAVSGIVPGLFRRPDGALTDGYTFHKCI